MTYLFQVTIKPQINDVELPAKTFSSENSFERCYERIGEFIKKLGKPEDKKMYEIIHTSSQSFID
jgi:hypothetical protein